MHLRYGPVVRVAPDEVSYASAPAWRAIYAPAGGAAFPKSPRWFTQRPNCAWGIMTSPNAEHARFRRTFAPAFTEKALAARAPLIAHHAAALVHKLRQICAAGETVNVTSELEFIVFDLAGVFTFSEPLHCLDAPENRVQISNVRAAMKGLAMRAMQRMLHIETLCNLVNSSITSVRTHKVVYPKTVAKWTRSRLEERSGPEREDLMEWAARNTGSHKALSPQEAENSVGDFMVAGTETIASTVVAALQFLLQAPAVMTALQAEIRNAAAEGEQSVGVERLAVLELLNAVINETMRLCPNLPAVLAREVPAPGADICGYYVPTGVSLLPCCSNSTPFA